MGADFFECGVIVSNLTFRSFGHSAFHQSSTPDTGLNKRDGKGDGTRDERKLKHWMQFRNQKGKWREHPVLANSRVRFRFSACESSKSIFIVGVH